ncbi:EscF/YscF/HrpA family type III secretion system needle major subunit [Vibrio aquimaris]
MKTMDPHDSLDLAVFQKLNNDWQLSTQLQSTTQKAIFDVLKGLLDRM